MKENNIADVKGVILLLVESYSCPAEWLSNLWISRDAPQAARIEQLERILRPILIKFRKLNKQLMTYDTSTSHT